MICEYCGKDAELVFAKTPMCAECAAKFFNDAGITATNGITIIEENHD